MSGHTPGPWDVHVYVSADFRPIKVVHRDIHTPGAASSVIAQVTHRKGWSEQQAANARLIAAAPSLLEHAAFLLDRINELDWSGSIDDLADEWNGHVEPPLYRLKLAIRKATGEA